MGTAEWIGIIASLVSGVGVPVLVTMASFAATSRRTEFNRVHERLDHLDTCIDEVRSTIYSKGVTREELAAFKADITEIITRMRTAISNETNGLHIRITRLEDPHFPRDGR